MFCSIKTYKCLTQAHSHFCLSFIALLMMSCVCETYSQVATVAVETEQLVLSQFF